MYRYADATIPLWKFARSSRSFGACAFSSGRPTPKSTAGTPNSFLCTGRDYGDFILEYEFKVDPQLNSGVQIRSRSLPTASEIQWDGKKISIPADRVHGYQIEIDPNPKQDRWWSAGIYDEARRGWLFPGILGGEGTIGRTVLGCLFVVELGFLGGRQRLGGLPVDALLGYDD